MITIDGTHISITRGDCEPFTITLTGEDVPSDGEVVLFSVKRDTNLPDTVFEKSLEIRDSKVVVRIMNDDTKRLPFGDYKWDIRFPNFYGENEPHTPMEPADFTIARVVGNV